jgi:anti-sigma regulatory factor (Ser/Thr protein kinase)
VATYRASFEFPPSPHAPGMARRVIGELFESWALDDALQVDAKVLVNELVSNAVDHAGNDVVLELDVVASDGWLRVGLADGSTIRPVVRELDHSAPRGRGMQIVSELAHRWGSEELRGGKRVWFELHAADSS